VTPNSPTTWLVSSAARVFTRRLTITSDDHLRNRSTITILAIQPYNNYFNRDYDYEYYIRITCLSFTWQCSVAKF